MKRHHFFVKSNWLAGETSRMLNELNSNQDSARIPDYKMSQYLLGNTFSRFPKSMFLRLSSPAIKPRHLLFYWESSCAFLTEYATSFFNIMCTRVYILSGNPSIYQSLIEIILMKYRYTDVIIIHLVK